MVAFFYFYPMKAAVLRELKSTPQWEEFSYSPPKEWLPIEVKAAALNRRDYWITQGQYPGIELPVILGSDVCGISQDREVIVNPGFDWGGNPKVQSEKFNILGLPSHGSLAETCYAPSSHIYDKPPHLNHLEAASLPLAGVTAYRSLFYRGGLQAGQKVLITGIGGGVASMCLVMALAAKAEVYVTSGNDEKLAKALDLGAHMGFNYKSKDYEKELKAQSGGLDLIIDSAAGEGLSRLISSVGPGGRVVFYGGTRGKIQNLNPQLIFWRQIDIKGSTMGSPIDFESMLSFVNQHQIVPIVHKVYQPELLNEAFEDLEVNNQFGKLVVDLT